MAGRHPVTGPQQMALRIVVSSAVLQECVSASKYCAFEHNGQSKYYVCHLNEVCCRLGCCGSLSSQFYHMWYYWAILVLLVIVCSSGGWWYRFCRDQDHTSAFPSPSSSSGTAAGCGAASVQPRLTASGSPATRSVPLPVQPSAHYQFEHTNHHLDNYPLVYHQRSSGRRYPSHLNRGAAPAQATTAFGTSTRLHPARRHNSCSLLTYATSPTDHDDDDDHHHHGQYQRRQSLLFKFRPRQPWPPRDTSESALPPSYQSTTRCGVGVGGGAPVVLYSAGSGGSAAAAAHPSLAEYRCPYYQLYGPPPSYESVVQLSTGRDQPQCRLFVPSAAGTSTGAVSPRHAPEHCPNNGGDADSGSLDGVSSVSPSPSSSPDSASNFVERLAPAEQRLNPAAHLVPRDGTPV